MTLSKEELKHLGEQGFIPGPSESEKAFVNRVDLLSKVSENPSIFLKRKTFEKWSPDFYQELGAIPSWLSLTYSDQNLLLWQGAVLWVLETPGREKVPIIQLRKGFRRGKFLFYSEKEVLLHETVHALRAAFDEPRFEEVLAYYHSGSRWRQFFGPLFRKPSHALFFIGLIFLSLMAQATSFFFLTLSFFPYVKFFTFLPLIDLVLRSAILIKDQRLLKKALKKIAEVFPDKKNAFGVAIRLKDSEIQKFATEPVQSLLNYIEEEIPKSVRWRQIIAQFCS